MYLPWSNMQNMSRIATDDAVFAMRLSLITDNPTMSKITLYNARRQRLSTSRRTGTVGGDSVCILLWCAIVPRTLGNFLHKTIKTALSWNAKGQHYLSTFWHQKIMVFGISGNISLNWIHGWLTSHFLRMGACGDWTLGTWPRLGIGVTRWATFTKANKYVQSCPNPFHIFSYYVVDYNII